MYEELYSENKGLLYYVARRYSKACLYDRAVSVEDLVQAGFFGLVQAQKTFDPEAGNWAGWAARYIAKEIYKALGLRDGKPVKAHWAALSLDAPLNPNEPDGLTGADVLEDDTLPAIDEAVTLDDMRRCVRQAVERLENDQQRLVIQFCGLEGQPYEAAAGRLGVSVERVRQIRGKALERLRRDKILREDAGIEQRTPYYRHVGLKAFRNTNTSATEKAVLWREEVLQRQADELEKIRRIEQELTEKEALYREKMGEIRKGGAVC